MSRYERNRQRLIEQAESRSGRLPDWEDDGYPVDSIDDVVLQKLPPELRDEVQRMRRTPEELAEYAAKLRRQFGPKRDSDDPNA